MTPRRPRGLSLPEVLIVVTLFSGFLLATHLLLSSGVQAWRRTASSQDSSLQLAKAERSLRTDLRSSGMTAMAVTSSASFASGGSSGDVLWMLSAVENNQEIARNEDGTARWRRNIVYYLAAPRNHDLLYGGGCDKKPYHCPHKLLLRRVFDGPNLAAPDQDIEALFSVAEVKARALAPEELSGVFSGPSAERDDIVATGMVSLEVSFGQDELEGEVTYRLRAFNGEEAGKVSSLGREDLRDSAFTHETLGSVFPGN